MQQLDQVFGALADPTRRAILARLARGDATVNEIVARFELSQPAISKHLKVLEGAGLITRGRDAQWRPCKLEAGPLKDAASWIENYRKFWEASLDRLEDYLNRLQSEPAEQPAKPKTPKTKAPKSTETKK